MNDAIVLVCSRIKSSRVPQKIFKRINGRLAIDHILYRLRNSKYPVSLLVPFGEADIYQKTIEYDKSRLSIFEGNSESPLHRMYDYIKKLVPQPRWIVRITHDDILTDITTMHNMVEVCEQDSSIDYCYAPSIIRGADCEVIKTSTFLEAAKNKKESTEFISYFVKGNKQRIFKPRATISYPYSLTLDYSEDAFVLETILRQIGNDALVDMICQYIKDHPWITSINELPLLSFYTCVKNGLPYIEETIQSILSYEFDCKYEYVIVDDFSTDGTIEKLAQYYDHPNVKIILNEKNLGLASSSNVALSHARGKTIMRIDADDILLNQSISSFNKMYEMIQNGTAVVYPSYLTMDEEGKQCNKIIDPRIHHHVGGALMDKRVINEVRFKEGLMHWDSLELNKRLHANGYKTDYLNDPTWIYRIRNDSMSHTDTEERKLIYKEIVHEG